MAEVATVDNNGNTLLYDEQIRQDLSSPFQRAIFEETEKKEPLLPFSYDAKVSILTQAINSNPVFNTIMNSITGTSAYIDRGTLTDIIVGQYMTLDSLSESYANTKGIPLISAEVLGKIINSVKEVEIDEVLNGVVLNSDGTVNHIGSAIQLGELYGVSLEQALAMQKNGLVNLARMNQIESFIPTNMTEAIEELSANQRRQTLIESILYTNNNSNPYFGILRDAYSSADDIGKKVFEEIIGGWNDERIDNLYEEDIKKVVEMASTASNWTKEHSKDDIFQLYIQKEAEVEVLSVLKGFHLIDGTASIKEEQEALEIISDFIKDEMKEKGVKDIKSLHSEIFDRMIDESGKLSLDKIREFAPRIIEGINNQNIHQSIAKFQGMHRDGANISMMETFEYEKMLGDMCAAFYSKNPVIQAALYEGMLPYLLDRDNNRLVTLAPNERLSEEQFFDLINSMCSNAFKDVNDPNYQMLKQVSLIDLESFSDRMEKIRRTIKINGETDYDLSDKSLKERTSILNADQYQITMRGKREYEKNRYSIQKNEIVSEVGIIKENDIKTNQKTLLKTYLEIYRREFIRVHGREPDINSFKDYSEEFAETTTAQKLKEVLQEQGIYQFLIDEDGMVIPDAVKQIDREFKSNDRRIARQVSKIERVSSRGAREDFKVWIKFDKLSQLVDSFSEGSNPSEEISKLDRKQKIMAIETLLKELPEELLTSRRTIQTIESGDLEKEDKKGIKKIISAARKREISREKKHFEKTQDKEGFVDFEEESTYDGRVLKQGGIVKRAIVGTSEYLQQFRRNLELRLVKKTQIGIEQILANNGDEQALVEQKATRWQKLMMGLRNALGDAETDAIKRMRFSHQAYNMGIQIEGAPYLSEQNIGRSFTNPEAMQKKEERYTDTYKQLLELEKVLESKEKQRVGNNVPGFNVLLYHPFPTIDDVIKKNNDYIDFLRPTDGRTIVKNIMQREALRNMPTVKISLKEDHEKSKGYTIKRDNEHEDGTKEYTLKTKSNDSKNEENNNSGKMKVYNSRYEGKHELAKDKIKIVSYRKTDNSFIGKLFSRRKKKALEYAASRERSMAGDKKFEKTQKKESSFVTRPEEYQNQNVEATNNTYSILFEDIANQAAEEWKNVERDGVQIIDYDDLNKDRQYEVQYIDAPDYLKEKSAELQNAEVLPGIEPIRFKELVRGDFPVYEDGADKVIETDSSNPDMTVDSQSLEQSDSEVTESVLPGSIAKISSVEIAAKTADAEDIIFTSMGTMVDDIDIIHETADVLPGIEEQYVGAGSFITNQTSVKQRIEAAADRAKADGEVSKATYERIQQEKEDRRLSDKQPIAEALAVGAREGYKKGFEAGQKQTFEEILEQAQNGNFVQSNKWQLPTEYTKATNKQGRTVPNPSYSSKGVTKMDPAVKKQKEEMAQKKAKSKQLPDSGR